LSETTHLLCESLLVNMEEEIQEKTKRFNAVLAAEKTRLTNEATIILSAVDELMTYVDVGDPMIPLLGDIRNAAYRLVGVIITKS
jgi:hypothetical protein